MTLEPIPKAISLATAIKMDFEIGFKQSDDLRDWRVVLTGNYLFTADLLLGVLGVGREFMWIR